MQTLETVERLTSCQSSKERQLKRDKLTASNFLVYAYGTQVTTNMHCEWSGWKDM